MISNESYFDYLTKRLDNGESNNVAVLESILVLKKKLNEKHIVKILDIGCFSGAMLNRILIALTPEERKRVKAVGFDFDKEVMSKGNIKYQDIIFIYGQVEKELPFIEQFDIILLSNILHEIAPSKKLAERKEKIKKVFSNIVDILAKDGLVIILDGCKPNTNNTIVIRFVSEKDKIIFNEFSKKYKALKIRNKETKDEIETDEISLTAFLTKARYIDKEYWESESNQLYQYFSEEDFLKMFAKNGLKLIKGDPQYFLKDQIDSLFQSIKPQIKTPAKNILLIAKK